MDMRQKRYNFATDMELLVSEDIDMKYFDTVRSVISQWYTQWYIKRIS